jgi:hypothetical protein
MTEKQWDRRLTDEKASQIRSQLKSYLDAGKDPFSHNPSFTRNLVGIIGEELALLSFDEADWNRALYRCFLVIEQIIVRCEVGWQSEGKGETTSPDDLLW